MDSKYYDLNVPRSTATAQTIARLLDCEYLYLAITVTVDMDQFHFNDGDSMRKKSKEARQEMRQKILSELLPPTREALETLLKDSEKFRAVKAVRPSLCPPRLFTRLNLAFSDTEQVGLFFKEFSDQIGAYDLLSLEPLTNYTPDWRLLWQPPTAVAPTEYFQLLAKDNDPFHAATFSACLPDIN
nr:unnamed protein product [Spirometra erinaceieuropaei]